MGKGRGVGGEMRDDFGMYALTLSALITRLTKIFKGYTDCLFYKTTCPVCVAFLFLGIRFYSHV